MLTGLNVTLRAPQDTDFIDLAQMRNDLDLQSLLMSQPRPNTVARVNQWITQLLEDGSNVFFIIESHGKLCGYLQIVKMNFLHGIGEIGICLKSEAQGQSVADEALALVENYVRDFFNIRKLTLQVLVSNIRAVRFYEKSGFRLIGIFERHFYQQGEFKDVALMEKLLISENLS